MWRAISDGLSSPELWVGVLASAAIPLVFARLNSMLREWGNPPWLKKQHQSYYQVKKQKHPSK